MQANLTERAPRFNQTDRAGAGVPARQEDRDEAEDPAREARALHGSPAKGGVMGKFTEVASKAVGKARQAAAALAGERGIFNRLKGEHQEVSMLLKRCAATDTSEGGIKERIDLYEKVRAELLAHATAEEEVFYSALEQIAETKALAVSSREQHDHVERILMELDSLAVFEPSWIERFNALVQEVEAHVRDEEDRLFPIAEKAITKQQARTLDERYHARKTRHMESLFPAAH